MHIKTEDFYKDIADDVEKCVIKRELKFNDCKDCLLNDKVMLKSQQRLKVKNLMYILKK